MPNPSAQFMLGKQEDWLKSYKGQLELQDLFFIPPLESKWFLSNLVETATSFSRETETKRFRPTQPSRNNQTSKGETQRSENKGAEWELDLQKLDFGFPFPVQPLEHRWLVLLAHITTTTTFSLKQKISRIFSGEMVVVQWKKPTGRTLLSVPQQNAWFST